MTKCISYINYCTLPAAFCASWSVTFWRGMYGIQ